MKLTLKESMVLDEARDPKLKYTEKQVKGAVDRVIVELEKQRSSAMTKLAQRYFKLDLALKKLQDERDKVNAEMKETVQGLFEATDIVYTRVVDTCSFTMTLAKQSLPKEKVEYDFEKIAEDLAKLIPDELQSKVDEIVEAHKKVSVTQPKSPAFTVKPKINEGVQGEPGYDIEMDNNSYAYSKKSSLGDKIKAAIKIVGSLVKKVTGWAVSYDKKLAKLKKDAGINPAAKIVREGKVKDAAYDLIERAAQMVTVSDTNPEYIDVVAKKALQLDTGNKVFGGDIEAAKEMAQGVLG